MQNKYHELHNFIRDSKTLNFCSLNDSVLSQDDAKSAILHSRDMLRDKRYMWADFRMLDVLKTCPGIDLNTIHQIHKALHAGTVTKQFLDSERTLEGLKHYGDDEVPSFTWNENFGVARSILEGQIGNKKLEPIHFSKEMDISDVFSDKTTSAGAIGRGSKADNWTTIVKYASTIIDDVYGNKPYSEIWIPAIPGHRSQLKNLSDDGQFNPSYEEKDRLIWVVDAATVCVEALFAKPMIEMTKEDFPGYAGGKTPDQLESMILRANQLPYWYCTDYSKFDQTIPSWLIHEAFNFVRNCFDIKYRKLIDWIEYNFTNTKMLLPNGEVVEVHKGIPSGSNFTQVIGSICNYLMGLTYLASTVDGTPDYKELTVKSFMTTPGSNVIGMFVMGDDNLFFLNHSIELKSMAQYLTHNFGVKVNANKTVFGYQTNPKFLSRTWTAGGCDRDQVDMCLNLVFSERIRDYETYSPYDILFSLFFTFPKAFHKDSWILSKWFKERFDEAGSNAKTLESVPNSDLPGSARALSEEARQQYSRYYMHLATIN